MGVGSAVLLAALLIQPTPAASLPYSASRVSDVPSITASLRPERVRVGGRVVLTVRVDYDGDAPSEIQLVHAPHIDIVEIVDRRRVGQWERDFVLVPTAVSAAGSDIPSGAGSPAKWVVEVDAAGQVYALDVVPPTVESAGDWVASETEGAGPTTVAGVPESGDPGSAAGDRGTVGAGLDGRPGVGFGRAPFDASVGSHLGPPSRRPIRGGWAERAHVDPWWPEIVPELHGYDAAVEEGQRGIVLEAGVAPATVYVGQQLSLFTTISFPPERTIAQPWYVPTELSGFSRVEVGAVALPQAREGDLQHSLTFQTAYFPRPSGQWGPSDGRGGARTVGIPTGRVMFAGPSFLDGPPISVTVLPIPIDGAPPGYRGAVGRFDVTASLEPQAVVWGQRARLRVEVRGVGDVRALGQPNLPQVSGGVLVPFRDMAWTEVRDGVVGGLRVFEYLLSPLDEGPVEVAPIVLSYFDPYVGDFGMAATEELRLEVVR